MTETKIKLKPNIGKTKSSQNQTMQITLHYISLWWQHIR